MLSYRILIFFALTVICQCRQSVDIPGIERGDGFSKCNSGGKRHEIFKHTLGSLANINLKYEDLDELTTVIATFKYMQLDTKAVNNAATNFLLLHDFVNSGQTKAYSGSIGYNAVCGWATQLVKIDVKVIFNESGNIELHNELQAGSWGAVSCAYVTSTINKVQVIY